MFSVSATGDYRATESWLQSLKRGDISASLDKWGQEGVAALRVATPVDTSETANSWTYEILREGSTWSIIWSNTHMAGPTPVVILLQYGHGTGTGGYIQGRDFINPAMKPIFDRIAAEMMKEVTR